MPGGREKTSFLIPKKMPSFHIHAKKTAFAESSEMSSDLGTEFSVVEDHDAIMNTESDEGEMTQ